MAPCAPPPPNPLCVCANAQLTPLATRALPQDERTVPRLFVMKRMPTSFASKFNPFKEKFRLTFLCSYDLSPARCGPDGEGYIIEADTQLMKDLFPALRFASKALKLIAIPTKILFKVELPTFDAPVADVAAVTPALIESEMAQWPSNDSQAKLIEAAEERTANEEALQDMCNVTAQAYHRLRDKMEMLDPKLTTLDMKEAVDQDGRVAWVKSENVSRWKKLSAAAHEEILDAQKKTDEALVAMEDAKRVALAASPNSNAATDAEGASGRAKDLDVLEAKIKLFKEEDEKMRAEQQKVTDKKMEAIAREDVLAAEEKKLRDKLEETHAKRQQHANEVLMSLCPWMFFLLLARAHIHLTCIYMYAPDDAC